MYSRVAYTEEIDDLNEAVADIIRQTEDFELKSASLAILYTEEETDYLKLYGLLSEKWNFPIVGCTAMAMLLGDTGYRRTGTSVMILTGDDCTFSVGMTDELTKDNYKDKMTDVFNESKSKLVGDLKLIISYGGMVAEEYNVGGDDLVGFLDELGGGVPVFGGSASDDFSFNEYRIFCNDRITKNGQLIVLVSGNIDPRFICINSVENMANYSYEITRSDKNLVYRLGNRTLMETLAREGMEVGKRDVFGDYLLSPFIVSVKKGVDDQVEVARNLSLLDKENETGFFLGAMPEGATINIGLLNRQDVQSTVQKAFDHILRETRGDASKRTILCFSCVARFLALASNTGAEAESYLGRLPDGMSLMGLYAYGEYCPTKSKIHDKEYNMFQNFSFAIMAI